MAIELTDGFDDRLKLVNTNICFYRIQMAREFASWHLGGIERAFLHDYHFSAMTWLVKDPLGLSNHLSDISNMCFI